MKYFCRMPKLYTDFSCTGADCPDNCCHGWGYILWSNKEYEKLCSLNCSEDIRSRIGNSFIRRDKDFWQINEQEKNGRTECAFLTEKGLCMIQAELGAEYLSSVCRIYPRTFYYNQNFVLKTCNSSCYRVMEMLMNDDGIMELTENIEQINDIEHIVGGYKDSDSALKKYPALKHRIELYSFFYNIISNKNYSVETAFVLGALAAQQISKFETNDQYDKIPKVLDALNGQLNNPEQIKRIEAIATNYNLKFNFVNIVLGHIYNCDIGIATLYENNVPSKEKYDIGINKLNKAFANRQFAFRNIALNILTECFAHYYVASKNTYENLCYLIACFACIKFIAVSEYYLDSGNDKSFIIKSCLTCRRFWHNPNTFDKVLSFLKEHNCTSPAHLALLIK